MKIGVMVESFRRDFVDAVRIAAEIGAEGIQKYATQDYNMTDAQAREMLDIVESHGLVFSALCGDFGHGFTDPDKNPELIDKSKRVLELSKKLGCSIVTTHIGVVPEEENETKEIIRKACRELAEFGDSIGAYFAVETGPESIVLRIFRAQPASASRTLPTIASATCRGCQSAWPVSAYHAKGIMIATWKGMRHRRTSTEACPRRLTERI